MQKTKKSVAKRFKLTATGKLIRRTPGFRHLLASKSTKQKRRASKDKLVAEGHAKPLKRCLPYGLNDQGINHKSLSMDATYNETNWYDEFSANNF